MVTAIIVLLAVIAVELAFLVVSRMQIPGRPSETGVQPPSPVPTSEKKEDNFDEYEKRWRAGMDAMMGYDLNAARRAVRNDGEERD